MKPSKRIRRERRPQRLRRRIRTVADDLGERVAVAVLGALGRLAIRLGPAQ